MVSILKGAEASQMVEMSAEAKALVTQRVTSGKVKWHGSVRFREDESARGSE